MTRIYWELDGERMFLSLEGHASGAPDACAAISGIVYGLAGYLTNAGRDGTAKVYTMDLQSGDAEIHATGDDRALGAFEAAVIGLKQIAKRFPDAVTVADPDD